MPLCSSWPRWATSVPCCPKTSRPPTNSTLISELSFYAGLDTKSELLGGCPPNGRILLVSSFLHGTAVVGAEDFPSLLGLQHRTCEAPYTAFRVDHQELD